MVMPCVMAVDASQGNTIVYSRLGNVLSVDFYSRSRVHELTASCLGFRTTLTGNCRVTDLI